MTLVGLLVFALVLFLIWVVITKFLPPPIQVWALAIVGVIAILFLISQLWPSALAFRIHS